MQRNLYVAQDSPSFQEEPPEHIRAGYETPLLVFMSADDSCCKDLFRFQPCGFLSKPLAEAGLTDMLRRISKGYWN
jgi:hypothetical protein